MSQPDLETEIENLNAQYTEHVMALSAKTSQSPKKKPPLYASKYDQSRYWKWQDLGPMNTSVLVEIEDVTEEILKNNEGEEDRKPCIHFTVKGKTKGMPLNKTNRVVLVEEHGDDLTECIGQYVIVFSTMTNDLHGKQVGCLRLRIPTAKELGSKSKRK